MDLGLDSLARAGKWRAFDRGYVTQVTTLTTLLSGC